jgi:predicted HAD superfamily Cof-like phosphohydrolase
VGHQFAAAIGWDLDEALARVHASNMSKVHPDGTIKRRADGKILKPETYEPPNLDDLI